ncbi:MAG: transketolase [Euryarchaeota archaeon]|nr:transketolase [Euryarchaeota archaeon]
MDITELEEMALRCRINIIRMIHEAQSGHPGGSLSAIDMIVGLYGTVLNINPSDTNWEDRDRFIMSKGHASPAVYSILYEFDIINEQDFMSFRKLGSVCQGHVDMKWTDGVDFSAGSLGMGLSFGLGCSLAAKLDNSNRRIWVMIGDGETQEGQLWEAIMAANFHSSNNLKLIIDRNQIQNDDFVSKQMEVGNLSSKIESFGWDVREIDGHNMNEICDAINWANNGSEGPMAIIANTIKGKGVSYMENNPSFHGKAPNDEEFQIAMEELS